MRATKGRSKGMRVLATAFALMIGLTSFTSLPAKAGMKEGIKKEYTTSDVENSLLELGKRAVKVGSETYDVTLSVKDKSFESNKKMPLSNTDVVFVVDTSASMDEDNGWAQLKNVLGDNEKGLIYNILGNGNEESNNSVTFVGYGGGYFTYTTDYYISDKFTSNNIDNAIAEYDSSMKMSSKIYGSKGGGNLIAGFEGAKKAIANLKKDGRNQVVVLITDGDPSVGHRIYTLYADSDNKPGEGWEEYRGSVSARYWKRMGNIASGLFKKYIYSKDLDAYNTNKEHLSDYGKDYEYKDTKWTKEVRTNLNSRIDITDPRQIKYTLEKAEELKKLTSNDKIYTVNVKNIKSSLLEKDLFKKHYYNATVKETGETLYNDIYDDLFKVGNYTYQATGIKLHDELSDFVEFDEKDNLVINIGENKVVLKPGTETSGVIPFAAEGENYGLGDVEVRYNKGDKSFNWTIAEGIPEGTTISLTYRVKLNKKAVKPGKGEDEDYKKGIQGLVNTDDNTGDHANKFAYPISKENQSYVNYGVEEVDNKGNSKRLKGENLDKMFPVAGVRPVIKYWLRIYHNTTEGKEIFQVSRYLEKGFDYFENIKNSLDYAIKNVFVVINNKKEETQLVKDSDGNLGISGKLDQDTELEFIYEKKAGKVVVKDIFERYGEEAFVVTRLEETVDFNAEKKYSALTEEELVSKAGKKGYPDYVGSYTTITPEEKKVNVDKDTTSVEFRYTLKEENIDVYDHFNGGEGVYRQGYELFVGKGNKIEYAPVLTKEEINAMGKTGDWQVVKQDDGKSFKVETNEAGVRSVHIYYLQKAKLHITHYYSDKEGEKDNKEELVEDVLFTDKMKAAVKENKDNQIAQAIIKRGEDGSETQLNFDSTKSFTDEFTIDNEDIYVELYYDYIPKDVVHTVRHIYEGSSESLQEVYTKAYKEEDEYRYAALNKDGWKLKEGSEREYSGIVSLEGQKEFTFTYVRDVVKVTVKDIVKDENGDTISEEIRYQGESEKNKPYKVDAISTVNSKFWDISPSQSIERVLTNDEEVFEFVYQKKTKTIKISDKYGDTEASVRSTSTTAIDAAFEVEPLLKDNWVVESVTVNNEKRELEDGKLNINGYGNDDIVFTYKRNERPSVPEERPEPQGQSVPLVPIPSIPVVTVTDDTTPQGSTAAPTTETNDAVDITEDETPQGDAEDETPQEDAEDEDTGIAEIDDDVTPQGEANKNNVSTEETIDSEDDTAPKGSTALPKTGGTNPDVLGLIGLGLMGLAVIVKRKIK